MKDELGSEFGELIERLVEYNAPLDKSEVIRKRIDVLERFLEVARFHLKYPKNNLALEDFLQGDLSITRSGKLRFTPAPLCNDLGTGTAPILLQPHLLLFLLLYHRAAYSVIDIIGFFIEKVRPDLTILDFKKTKTGVTRCHTNARFAANTLRDYGLLKYTPKEAYKTWLLSLPGFIAAAQVLQGGSWVLRKPGKDWPYRLHPSIYDAWEEIKDYRGFVSRLSGICRPNVELFDTFEPVLKSAFGKLNEYWRILRDEDLKQKEKIGMSTELIDKIDSMENMEQFYSQFSDCLNIEELVKRVEKQPGGGDPPPETRQTSLFPE